MPLPVLLLSATVSAAEPVPAGPVPTLRAPSPCTPEALAGTHPDTLRVLRNTVYARHGRPFTSPDLQALFARSPGYARDPGYTDARLTDSDRACIARIRAVEAAPRQAPVAPDLDGDGTPEPVRWDGRTLTVGTATWSAPDGGSSPGAPPVVVDLDPLDGGRELVVTTDPGVEDERRITVVRYAAGRLVPLLDAPLWLDHGHYAITDRALVHTARTCGQAVTLRLRLDGDRLRPERTVEGAYDPTQCAACPLLVQVGGPAPHHVGELLRHQRAATLERTDRLPLGWVPAGDLHLRLVELKPETTLLDAIYVELDGVRVSPRHCGDHCVVDGARTPIPAGGALDLTFPLPTAGSATVVGHGYYVPHQPVDDPSGTTRLVPAP